MKKGKLLNSEISYVISKMGHTDSLTIADSGLPIPDCANRIDLALSKGIPSFLDTLDAVLSELCIEKVIIAKEMKDVSPDMYVAIQKRLQKLEEQENIDVEIIEVEHETFKKYTSDSKCIIRTGEFTAYSNIILKSGVVF